MPFIIVRHRVEDYGRWKSAFDGHGPARQANGSRGGYVFRSVEDPNEVLVVLEWDDLERARRFAQSDDLRESMLRAGIADLPDVYFVNEADRPAA